MVGMKWTRNRTKVQDLRAEIDTASSQRVLKAEPICLPNSYILLSHISLASIIPYLFLNFTKQVYRFLYFLSSLPSFMWLDGDNLPAKYVHRYTGNKVQEWKDNPYYILLTKLTEKERSSLRRALFRVKGETRGQQDYFLIFFLFYSRFLQPSSL